MRRRKDPFEKPWVIIAAVVGIIAVIVIALFFFMGSGSSAPAGTAGQQPATTSTNSSAEQTVAVGVAPSVIKTQVPVTLPQEGVFVKVSYLGGFSGTYGMVGNMTTVGNSGDRVYVIENATGVVSATFHKEDDSKHEIDVEIWNDGKAQQVAKNTSSFGVASVTYTV
jgi:hypothetical protein